MQVCIVDGQHGTSVRLQDHSTGKRTLCQWTLCQMALYTCELNVFSLNQVSCSEQNRGLIVEMLLKSVWGGLDMGLLLMNFDARFGE